MSKMDIPGGRSLLKSEKGNVVFIKRTAIYNTRVMNRFNRITFDSNVMGGRCCRVFKIRFSEDSYEVPMPDYDALKDVLGKTIKGVIVKKNVTGQTPAVSVHFIFNDDTSYEIYSLYQMSFAGGLNHWDMDGARKYGNPPMENVLDITVDDA
jgi:hypothetical protein